MSQTFKALVVRQDGRNFTRSIEQRNIDDLPKGDVLIRVHYSSLNYKDGLSCSGNRTVTRHYPHTPGIDAAGIVEFSCVDDFKVGDSVVVISYDLGANTAGGFGQFIRVPGDWVMPLPKLNRSNSALRCCLSTWMTSNRSTTTWGTPWATGCLKRWPSDCSVR